MPDFAIDFSQVEADKFTVVPPGNYSANVKTVTLGQKESDGEETFPYLRFELAIDEGDHTGRVLFFYASFAPDRVKDGRQIRSSLPRTKALLESFGVDVSGNVQMKVDPATNVLLVPDLVGEPCKIRVRADTYEGEPTARVARLEGLKGAPTTAASNGAAPKEKAGAGAGERYK